MFAVTFGHGILLNFLNFRFDERSMSFSIKETYIVNNGQFQILIERFD